MTAVQTRRISLPSQLTRFALVGGLCALVDSGSYWLLLQLGVWVHLAKALSFVIGTIAAFFLNRRFTFNATGGATGFAVLYTATFFVNVGANALMLALLPSEYALAWLVAQATAAAINFMMLRLIVFRTT